MSVSALNKSQWFSVVKNVVFAGVAAYVASVQSGDTHQAAVLVAVMAGLKIVEKILTPTT